MHKSLENTLKLRHVSLKKSPVSSGDDLLRQLAFEYAAQANIITCPDQKGKILLVNNAACKLLGYSKAELLTKSREAIFNIRESCFIKMLKQRKAAGQSTALVTAIKKSGKPFPCAVTSAFFMDAQGLELAITTIADISQSILKQKIIDIKKQKIVSHNIDIAKSEQKRIDVKNEKEVADNIVHAKSVQKRIDSKNEKMVAANIFQAKAKQKRIDTKNEKTIADNIDLAKCVQKKIDTKNKKIVSDNIDLAKFNQKKIDILNEKIVSENILLAQAKSDSRQAENSRQNKALEEKLEREIKLKEKQIAEATEEAKDMERSEIGRELHDNVNQLLGASKLYLEMAKKRGPDSEMFLNRSTEYTLTAIEEIRKLTKGLTTDIIKDLGLCDAIENIVREIMEINPVKILCTLESFIEDSVDDKFKLNIFRIVQEQLNNILKHAKATEANISLLQNKRSIMLSISDNGIGFDTEKKQKGIGLVNIKSRAVSYNGMAEFVAQKNQGCVLTVRFPLTGSLQNNDE